MHALYRVAIAAIAAMSGVSPAWAQDEPAEPFTITGSTALASQYRFRGISLSNEELAVQGSINLNHESGFYVGTWASSLDGFGELGGSNVEVDIYGGYRAPLGESGATLDVGLLYYAYPGSTGGDFEFFEPYANVSGTLGPVSAKVGFNYAWDQSALLDNSNFYVFGDVSTAIPNTPLTLKAHIGYSEGDTPLSPTGEYIDYLVGADFTIKNLTLGVAYVDTDIKSAGAIASGVGRDIVDGAVVVSLTAAF